jgi:hypothetical protein
MSDVDRVILEIADDRQRGTSAADVWINWPEEVQSRPTDQHVHRRVRELYDRGFLEREGNKRGWYILTEVGDKYLNDPDATIEDFTDEDDED